jgi:hypothetical protein
MIAGQLAEVVVPFVLATHAVPLQLCPEGQVVGAAAHAVPLKY